MRDLSPEEVTAICRHPEVWPFISDDGSPPVDSYNAPPGFTYLGDDGFFAAFAPVSYRVYDAHIAAIPERRGNCSLLLCECLKEMRRRGAVKILAHVPSYNGRAIACFLAAGMEIEGFRKASFLLHGILHDQTCLGSP